MWRMVRRLRDARGQRQAGGAQEGKKTDRRGKGHGITPE